jgi:hypothetical protein
MTPDQLLHLAEQADYAAGFFAPTNPSAARRFADCAATARLLADQLNRAGQLNELQTRVRDVRARLNQVSPVVDAP